MHARAVVIAFLLSACAGLACDRKWDFECTAIWRVDNIELSRKTYSYEQMSDEKAASARCKEDAFQSKPKKANGMTCECKGVD